jgi:peroxiredoxin
VKYWLRFVGVFLILILGVVGCAEPTAEAEAEMPEGIGTGNRARDFTLRSLDGAKVSLSDYRGNVVLVNFWATWCAPCRAEIPDFEEAYQAYKDEGFVILGVNEQESPDIIEPFLAEMGATYPVLLDEQGQVMSEYRVLGLPTSLLLDQDGVIQTRHTGILSIAQLETQLAKLLPER